MKLDRITISPSRMNGQPCIRNMRLTVRRVLEALAVYTDRSELRQEYPELDDPKIFQEMVDLTVDHMKPVCGHLRRSQHALSLIHISEPTRPY